MYRQNPIPTLVALILLILANLAAAKSPDSQPRNLPQYAPDRVLVKFLPGTAASDIGIAHRKANGLVLKTIPLIGVQVIQVPNGSVPARVAAYQANPNVLYAEPDYYRLLVVPDPDEEDGPTPAGGSEFFAEQWYLKNVGQDFGPPGDITTGAADADINAPEGWDYSQGEITSDLAAYNTPKVAVLDSGTDCGTKDLIGKCLEQVNIVGTNPGIFGLDPCPDPAMPACDNLGHGTFTAGEIVANTGNNEGLASVGWNTGAGIFKVCYAELISDGTGFFVVGLCPVSASAAAIVEAASDQYDSNGALIRSQYHVISMSYGSDFIDEAGGITPTTASNAECDAVRQAWEQGVVVVAAAGNNGNTNRVYPAACTDASGNPTVIAVAASDSDDNRASFSTYSIGIDHWVSMAAPGKKIIGLIPDGYCSYPAGTDSCVDWWDGTSMAAPLVAGGAALVWTDLYRSLLTSNPSADLKPGNCTYAGNSCNQVVRQRLESSAAKFGVYGQDLLEWTRHGRLDMETALSPDSPSNNPPVAAFSYSCTGLDCQFNASASSDDTGITSYEWDFDQDGITDTVGMVVTFGFAGSGSYSSLLTVTDEGSLQSSVSASMQLKNGRKKTKGSVSNGGDSDDSGDGGGNCPPAKAAKGKC
ncbi:S8 family peptidase [Amphritea sp. HPY]|uniref:S8 family peptidase n=1 Tax=Amphritea sp. HPY TaxID=3421652 RepID=UPI003D7C812A